MTVFAEALARGVQRHGAVLALYTLPTIYMQSVCGVVQDVPPIAKKRRRAGPGSGFKVVCRL
jgi:hypothetical protein